MKQELFGMFGYMLMLFATGYATAIKLKYGGNLPVGVEQWLAEFYVGFLVVAALAFIATARHIGNVRRD